MITLTDAARTRFQTLIVAQKAQGLRVGVKKSGCAGLTYQIDLDQEDHSGHADWHVIDQGVRVFVHESSRPFLEGMTIDWQSQGLNQRVVFPNPNERSSCGCGESFGV